MKNKIAKWYKQGLWTDEKVWNAVDKGVLTKEKAREILGTEEAPADGSGA